MHTTIELYHIVLCVPVEDGARGARKLGEALADTLNAEYEKDKPKYAGAASLIQVNKCDN